jgi:chemotaxis protein methyltransferase CheR
MSDNGEEFEFSDSCFKRICHFVLVNTGIVLGEKKKKMVYGRLVKYIRSSDFSDFPSLCDALESDNEAQKDIVINAITTNLTAFFREAHHFDFLAEQVIPELIEKNKASKRLRIWSAGCSSGEEAYSIAMILKDELPDFEQWDVKILATDLDANVLVKAKQGVYQQNAITGISSAHLQRYCFKGQGANSGSVKMSDELRNIIYFKRLNLLHDWPMTGKFDVIFCRNVVIYFGKDTQRVLFERYANLLTQSGYLFLGHSESLYNVSQRFKLLGKTIYKNNQYG